MLFLDVDFEFTELTPSTVRAGTLIFGAKKMILERDEEMYIDLHFLGTGDPGVWKRPPKNTKGVFSQNGVSERKKKKKSREEFKNPDNEMRRQREGNCTQRKLLNPHSSPARMCPLSWSCR